MQSTLVVMGKAGGRMVSTGHGQRRILKRPPPVLEYIEKAVETGVYRTSEEINAAMDALRKGHSGSDMVVEPRVAVERFRKDFIRGTQVQDYPAEYHILAAHPPIPDPPRTPKKLLRRMQQARPKHPTKKLVQKYLNRQEKPKATTEDYYRRLLGVEPPADNYAMSQKSSALSQAYVYAIKQYEVMKTQDVSEKEALAIVDKLLAEEKRDEGQRSRSIRDQLVQNTNAQSPDQEPIEAAKSLVNNLPSIFHDKPRVLQGLMQWSNMLQNSGVSYEEWTVGASTALDHWIAKNILDLSEPTWDALLEGNDPSLQGRGEDIVLIRETLFPETKSNFGGHDELARQEEENLQEPEVPQPPAAEEQPEQRQKSVEELLQSLRGLGNDPRTEPKSFNASDKEGKDEIQQLTEELQEWRTQNSKTPYEEWSDENRQRFNAWMERYLDILATDTERRFIDLDETRDALLSQPPMTEDESDRFWDSLRDETRADLFLQNLLKQGPPEGLTAMQQQFWTLSYEQQLERLVNLGALRPLLDDYLSEEARLDFMRRYGDYLLDGVEMEHLVPDPQGPITGADLPAAVMRKWGVTKEDRFRMVTVPYRSGKAIPRGRTREDDSVLVSADKEEEEDEVSGSEASMERSRALFHAWNQHKAGRARYEEALFVRGDLGLTYSSKTANELRREMEEEEKNK